MSEHDRLLRAGRRRPLFDAASLTEVDLDRGAVQRMLPHRDPFLMVDRITHADLAGGAVIGERYVDAADPVLAGHFPGDPVYPGCLLLELIGQTGLCMLHLVRAGRTEVLDTDSPMPVRLMRMHGAVFSAEVRPGQTVRVFGRILEHDDLTALFVGQVLREDGTPCVASIQEVYLPDPETTDA